MLRILVYLVLPVAVVFLLKEVCKLSKWIGWFSANGAGSLAGRGSVASSKYGRSSGDRGRREITLRKFRWLA
jgi:hypothetical protein